MSSRSSQAGLVIPALIVVVVLALVAAGIAYVITSRPALAPTTDDTGSEYQNSTADKTISPSSESGSNTATYTGAVLAGSTAPLLDFTQADFDAAMASDKLIVLYFYANWCPICREEFPKMQAAFNKLTSDEVVGFRVNFNDSDTDPDEKALAREHGIAYQHTKVFIKNKQQVLKSPESWEQSRYHTEITNALR